MVDDREYSLFDSAMKMPWDDPYFSNGKLKMLLIIRISSGLAVTGTIICMTGICIILKQYIPGAGNLDFEVKLTKT